MKGGVARYLSDLVRASKGAMKVIVPNEHGDPGEPVEYRAFFGSGWIRWWPLVRLMRELGQEKKTRVFISHVLPIGTAAWIASWFGGAPYILLFHGLDLHLAQRTALKRWLTKWIVARAQAICVNSQFVAEECKLLFPGIAPVLLTPGYEPHALPSRAEARAKLGLASDEVILLNVTRLIPRKGLDRLIDVLPELPSNVRAVSIGDGQDRARLEALAATQKSRITFLGAIDDQTRDEWYAAADIFVFPVRTEGDDLEGYGIVCLEASAAGLPVIVGMNGGAPETVIQGETGLIVNAEHKEELLTAIQQLVADPALRLRMGEQGRARVLTQGKWSERWNTLSKL
jgi:phosphatidylinositol alpha-1,6-mannosyltransferase